MFEFLKFSNRIISDMRGMVFYICSNVNCIACVLKTVCQKFWISPFSKEFHRRERNGIKNKIWRVPFSMFCVMHEKSLRRNTWALSNQLMMTRLSDCQLVAKKNLFFSVCRCQKWFPFHLHIDPVDSSSVLRLQSSAWYHY